MYIYISVDFTSSVRTYRRVVIHFWLVHSVWVYGQHNNSAHAWMWGVGGCSQHINVTVHECMSNSSGLRNDQRHHMMGIVIAILSLVKYVIYMINVCLSDVTKHLSFFISNKDLWHRPSCVIYQSEAIFQNSIQFNSIFFIFCRIVPNVNTVVGMIVKGVYTSGIYCWSNTWPMLASTGPILGQL